MTTTAHKTPIQISSSDPNRQVVITQEDEDRFSLTCAQAIEACKIHTNRKVWFEELASLFEHVRVWVEKNKAIVHACYAVPRAGQVVIFIVPAADSFDFSLSDSLADLSLEISEKFQLIAAEVLQIPGKDPDHLQTFLNAKVAKTLHVSGK
jgi:hypothetical protein